MIQNSAFSRDPRITSRGWSIERGEYATISVPKGSAVDGVVPYFLRRISKFPTRKLPTELKRKAEIYFGTSAKNVLIKISIRTQDTRAEKAVDSVSKGILALCRK